MEVVSGDNVETCLFNWRVTVFVYLLVCLEIP